MSNRFENKSKLTLFLILAISVLFLLIVFEKLVGITLDHQESETRYIRLRENAPLLNLQLKPSDVDLQFSENLENKTYDFSTDKNGFLQPSLIHDNADLTLAFIGGSTTECMYVDADKRFHHVVSQLLSNQAHTVNSINAGVSGNDSINSINAYLNKVIPIKPDIAFLMHNINDLSTLVHEGSYWNSNQYRSPIIYQDKSIKALIKTALPNTFELLYRLKSNLAGPVDEFAHDRDEKKTLDEQHIYSLFAENLMMFISISKAKGITPVLMTQASRFTAEPDQIILNRYQSLESLGISYPQFKSLFDGMNQTIRKVALENNVTLIDLAKAIPASNEFIVDTVHFSNKGSELVAKVIASKIKDQLNQTSTNKIEISE